MQPPPVRLGAWSVVRLLGSLLILAAVAHQLTVTVSNALASATPHGSHLPTVVVNFVSFFTIESNLLAAAALALAGVWGLRAAGEGPEPRWLAVLLACASTYLIATGVVYNLLLRGVELPQGTTVVWANEVLHVVGPLLLLADVLLAPRRRRLAWRTLAPIVAFPIVWVAYTLVRGPRVTSPLTGNPWWYPYPFLDPHQASGYATVALYVGVIAVSILAIGAGVVRVSRQRGIPGKASEKNAAARPAGSVGS